VISVSADQIGQFLNESTEGLGLSRATRHLHYAQLKAFFNYIIEVAGLNTKNPCTAAVLAKAYKKVPHGPRKILDKETVDEIIFNAGDLRNLLILELQARCSLRIGEVLKLRTRDLSGRKILIETPKSGREAEIPFLPEHIAARPAEYVSSKGLSADARIFPLLLYNGAKLGH
jgi:integrase